MLLHKLISLNVCDLKGVQVTNLICPQTIRHLSYADKLDASFHWQEQGAVFHFTFVLQGYNLQQN